MIQRILCGITFLVLTMEVPGLTFEDRWSTPWHYVTEWLMMPVPGVRIWWLDVLGLLILLVASAQKGARGGRVKALSTAMMVSIATLLAWGALGALSGGDIMQMRLQLHVPVMIFVLAFTCASAMRTPEHFRMLGRTVVYASLFRAVMMFLFYLLVMRGLNAYVAVVTDHGDSITFVVTIVIVVANAIHSRSKKSTIQAALVVAIMLWCIQVNHRRLAWANLVCALAVMYFLLPSGRIRRKIHRKLMVAVPVVLLYVAVGWTRPTGIFTPIASLQSMNSAQDKSTESRILENIGLVVTLQEHPLVGTGFGHQYFEVSHELAAASFKEYRYNPHNSVLGLLAFTGAIGFIGIWMTFPVAVYLSARAYIFGRTPLERSVAMVAACEIIVHLDQMWGDLGVHAPAGLVLTSGALAAASRIAVKTGAWPRRAAAQA